MQTPKNVLYMFHISVILLFSYLLFEIDSTTTKNVTKKSLHIETHTTTRRQIIISNQNNFY